MSTHKEENKKEEKATGRYVYDKKLGKVVKISDDIPGLKKGGADQGGVTALPLRLRPAELFKRFITDFQKAALLQIRRHDPPTPA